MGIVQDRETGNSIGGVSVMLVDSDDRVPVGVLSDDEGRFEVTAPWTGRFRIRCERIGYGTVTSTEVDLLPPDSVVVELLMSVEAVVLEPLTITSNRGPLVMDTRLARWGYYDRRAQFETRGTGRVHFLGYESIGKRNPGRVTDMFADLSGVKVTPTGRRGLSVQSRRPSLGQRTASTGGVMEVPGINNSGRGCGLTVYLDGVRLGLEEDESINDYVQPPHLSAIEVYVTAPYPVQYAPAMNDCGSIIIWTGFVKGKGK